MRRSEEREHLMQMLYQMSIQNDFTVESAERFKSSYTPDAVYSPYFNQAYICTRDHLSEIDTLIDTYGKNWKAARMPKVDLSILRLALAEIFYLEDMPLSVSINEAVDLGKKFGTEESGKFINGILGNIVKEENVTK